MNTSWQQWTLRHIRGVMEKLEQFEHSVSGLLDDNKAQAAQLERMRSFAARTDLTLVDSLLDDDHIPAAQIPTLVLRKLAPYFDSELLLERPIDPNASWTLTAFCTRGEYFYLDITERINVDHLVQALGPNQVLKASAESMLAELPVPFTHTSRSALAFLLMPNPTTAYILISDIPELWREDHVRRSLRLINDAFIP